MPAGRPFQILAPILEKEFSICWSSARMNVEIASIWKSGVMTIYFRRVGEQICNCLNEYAIVTESENSGKTFPFGNKSQ